MNSESWFGVRALLRAAVNGGKPKDPVFEERILVVQAPDERIASDKAAKFIGEESYPNEDGEAVEWLLDDVLDVTPIYDEAIRDGTEVYSSILDEEGASLRRRDFER